MIKSVNHFLRLKFKRTAGGSGESKRALMTVMEQRGDMTGSKTREENHL